jgi:hypothetical protein
MRVALALSVVTVFACSNTNPHVTDPGVGDPIGSQPGQLPDGGRADGGTDAGTTTDAGTDCNLQALPPSGAFTLETCSTGAQSITNETFITAGCDQVQIFGGVNCFGGLTGPSNAFSGVCNTFDCTSTHIPGTISCIRADQTKCTIQICADITGTNCPQ